MRRLRAGTDINAMAATSGALAADGWGMAARRRIPAAKPGPADCRERAFAIAQFCCERHLSPVHWLLVDQASQLMRGVQLPESPTITGQDRCGGRKALGQE
jgi:hypothetical protein